MEEHNSRQNNQCMAADKVESKPTSEIEAQMLSQRSAAAVKMHTEVRKADCVQHTGCDQHEISECYREEVPNSRESASLPCTV